MTANLLRRVVTDIRTADDTQRDKLVLLSLQIAYPTLKAQEN